MKLFEHAPQTGGIWKRSFISAVRPTVHSNPSQKRSLSKTLLKPEEFENAALFLRLGLPSTVIRHKSEAFRRHFSNRRNLKTPIFYKCGRKTFWKRSFSFRKWWRHVRQPFGFTDRVFLKHESGDCYVFKFLRRSVDGKYLMCFQSETSIFKFFRHSACWRGLNRISWKFLRAGNYMKIRHVFSFVFKEAI